MVLIASNSASIIGVAGVTDRDDADVAAVFIQRVRAAELQRASFPQRAVDADSEVVREVAEASTIHVKTKRFADVAVDALGSRGVMDRHAELQAVSATTRGRTCAPPLARDDADVAEKSIERLLLHRHAHVEIMGRRFGDRARPRERLDQRRDVRGDAQLE